MVLVSGIRPLMASSFGGMRALGGHQHRRGGRKPERPHGCSTDVSGRAGGAIIQALDALRELTDQESADDGAHAPRNERRQFGEDSHQRDGLPRRLEE